jgi:hypothetical protein
VTISWEWTEPAREWIASKWKRGDEVGEQVSDRLEKLRSRKEQVTSELDERRKATRFEPDANDGATSLQDAVDQGGATQSPRSAAPKPEVSADEPDDGDYTSRLLKAKNAAFKRKDT